MDPRYIALAPTTLPNFRTRRYLGDDLCLAVDAFTPEDQSILRDLYAFLQKLVALVSPESEAVPSFSDFLEAEKFEDLSEQIQALGHSSYDVTPTALMAKTIHDLRGGGLGPLLAQIELSAFCPVGEAERNALYFLTRDHLKIMRNALTGLDDAKREADLLPKVHSTNFIVEKWNGAVLHRAGRDIKLNLDCPQPVAISECCVEFGALDRILYNLINNACRHSAGESIDLTLAAVPDSEGENLRFVLANSVSAPDLSHLRGIDLRRLFEAGTSTTGSGYGLAIAADFVVHAYGLDSNRDAVAKGYLGATLLEERFAVWFHWPRVVED